MSSEMKLFRTAIYPLDYLLRAHQHHRHGPQAEEAVAIIGNVDKLQAPVMQIAQEALLLSLEGPEGCTRHQLRGGGHKLFILAIQVSCCRDRMRPLMEDWKKNQNIQAWTKQLLFSKPHFQFHKWKLLRFKNNFDLLNPIVLKCFNVVQELNTDLTPKHPRLPRSVYVQMPDGWDCETVGAVKRSR